jgi:Ser/Thr protein kinase RdoA (MazF antagonist)
MSMRDGATLKNQDGFEFAVFPKAVGRMPQEFLSGDLKSVGRSLAHLHNVGAQKKAKHRYNLDAQTYGYNSLPVIERYCYPELWHRYRDLAEPILEYLEDVLDPSQYIRIHGDCHRGNLLQNGKTFFFVDFDDFCNGPAVQDFWMLFGSSLDKEEGQEQCDEICEGYAELREIPENWELVEPLRGLRIIMYAGWIGARWGDSYFPKLFPQYTTYNYWLEEIEQLQRITNSF